jgi:hypothetical protein
MADPLDIACSLVGRFQYHFGRIEQKIDQAVISLLDLDDKAGPIVTGNVDFFKKLNLVRTATYQQLEATGTSDLARGSVTVCPRSMMSDRSSFTRRSNLTTMAKCNSGERWLETGVSVFTIRSGMTRNSPSTMRR